MSMHITIDDVRKAGICVAGARRWFDQHGIPFADFVQNGVSAETLAATGDALAQSVIEKKAEREGANG